MHIFIYNIVLWEMLDIPNMSKHLLRNLQHWLTQRCLCSVISLNFLTITIIAFFIIACLGTVTRDGHKLNQIICWHFWTYYFICHCKSFNSVLLSFSRRHLSWIMYILVYYIRYTRRQLLRYPIDSILALKTWSENTWNLKLWNFYRLV